MSIQGIRLPDERQSRGDDTAKRNVLCQGANDGVVTRMDENGGGEISYATFLTDGDAGKRTPCSDSPDEGAIGSRQRL